MDNIETNQYFDLAVQFVNSTDQSIFLTGKAGTGKTTFLKHIKETSSKKLAVVAPTGVAAINAGGVTIHSMFQLPLGSFLPTRQPFNGTTEGNFHNQIQLLQHLKFNRSKKQLLQELELLIIDEVSMIRADLLDAVDFVLKSVRKKKHLPFGGVQVLYIGDLFQLPPVIKEEEWKVLKEYYPDLFFFHANAVKESAPLYLELKKIYRQSDATFIDLLNKLRNDQLQQQDLDLLNSYYKPDFTPEKKGEFITLTTHNSKADVINNSELKKLTGKLHTFEAEIKGEFNERSVPAELKLQLKEGAQIMFIRNDKGEAPRYYNGKIGTIKRIEGEKIFIEFPGNNEELQLEKEIWRNVRFKYSQESDQIEEEELGTFMQYPVRLAWAITIHKSQGLTFNKAIIDAGESFAPGQVYVALSRMSSLEGLVLHSKIGNDCISSNDEAIAFGERELAIEELLQQLKEAQKKFIHHRLLTAFDWTKLLVEVKQYMEDLPDSNIALQKDAMRLMEELLKDTVEQEQTSQKFIKQLETLLSNAEEDKYAQLAKRVKAACDYFSEQLDKQQIQLLNDHQDKLKVKAKVKKYLREVDKIHSLFSNKKKILKEVVKIAEGLKEGMEINKLLEKAVVEKKRETENKAFVKKKDKSKPVKGESHLMSLALFRQGKSILEIAEERGLALGTIEGHLTSFISTGELKVEELVAKEKIELIIAKMEELGEVSSSIIKESLGDGYSYGEIRAVMNHLKAVNNEQ